MSAGKNAGLHWAMVTAPLALGLIVVGALSAFGRPLFEALLASALVGAGAAFLLVKRADRAPATRAPRAPAAEVHRNHPDAESFARLTTHLADLFPDAIVGYWEDGTIAYANPAARDLFFEGQNPCGQNFLRIAGAAPKGCCEALLGESDRLFTVEIEHQPETYHLSRRVVELGGQPLTLLVIRNLTHEISRREVATLKNVVRVISHEVNNSLAPIVSLVHSAKLIAERPEHANKLSSVFDTIEDRSNHLMSFLEGYAGLARLPTPRPQLVDWARFFEHVRALYPRIALPEVPEKKGWFDPVQIEQVLINIVKNALEAGSAETAIEIRITVDSDGASRFEVADRGPGFSAEALASAFVPLYTTKEKGSGMGHSLCREIVEAHRGRMSLGNREGGGALVAWVLPGPIPVDPALSHSRAKLTLSRIGA